MIRDARVLDEQYVLLEVPHRNAELNHLSTALEPIEQGASSETVLMTGPSGAGKTMLAKYVVWKLREQVLDVETQYVTAGRTTL